MKVSSCNGKRVLQEGLYISQVLVESRKELNLQHSKYLDDLRYRKVSKCRSIGTISGYSKSFMNNYVPI